MRIDAIKHVVNAEPFRPFTLRLADGRGVKVGNPDLVAFLGSGRTLFVAHPRSERFELIDLMLINSIIVENGESYGNGDGKKGRR